MRVAVASPEKSEDAERLSWGFSVTMRITASLHRMGDCLTSSCSACKDATTATDLSGIAACRLWRGINANQSKVNKKPFIRFTLQSYKICVRPRRAVKKTSPERHIGLSLRHDYQPTHHHRHPLAALRLVVPHAVFQHSDWSRMALVGEQRIGFVFYCLTGDVWVLCKRRAEKKAEKIQIIGSTRRIKSLKLPNGW